MNERELVTIITQQIGLIDNEIKFSNHEERLELIKNKTELINILQNFVC